MRQRRIFDEHYVEKVRFGPGHVASVRLMRPDDRERVLQARLPRSRLRLELDFFCAESARQVALIALSEAGAAIGAARGFRVRAGAWSATITAIDPKLAGPLLDLLTTAMLDRGACEVRFDFSPTELDCAPGIR